MTALEKAHSEILEAALAYPEAWKDHPWGETVAKVRKKVFLFSGIYKERLSFSFKLKDTGEDALMLPFTKPTGYGLGRSGWVSASFGEGDDVPVPLLLEWLDESYRFVAPKTLVKKLPPIE